MLCRYLIYSTQTIQDYETFVLSDWMFFCITINVSIANLLTASAAPFKEFVWALISSCLLVGIAGFVLALSMFVPQAFARANMQTLNITGLLLVLLTSILYLVIFIKSKR